MKIDKDMNFFNSARDAIDCVSAYEEKTTLTRYYNIFKIYRRGNEGEQDGMKWVVAMSDPAGHLGYLSLDD